MSSIFGQPVPEPDLEALVEEFLAASDQGAAPELGTFLERAGSRAGELRHRLELLGLLELAMTLLSERWGQHGALPRFPLHRD